MFVLMAIRIVLESLSDVLSITVFHFYTFLPTVPFGVMCRGFFSFL